MFFVNVAKFPAAKRRSVSFCCHISHALRSSRALVVKWPCQKSESFSCSGVGPDLPCG